MTNGQRTNERGSFVLLLAVVAAGVIAAVLLLRPNQAGGPGISDAPSAASDASLAASRSLPGVAPVIATLPDDSYDLAYDQSGRLLWLAVMQISEPDWLYAFAADGSFERWQLPDVQHNGYLSQIEVDSLGAVWVTEAYVLSRLDPETHEVSSLTFDEVDPDAVPGALDPGNPNPGTWISAIAPFGDGVLVARNNVAAFVAYDSALERATTIRVASAYAGPSDLLATSDGIVALGSQTSLDRLALFSRDGTLVRETRGVAGLPETRLSPAGDSAVLVTGSPASIVTLADFAVHEVDGCGIAAGAAMAGPDNEDTICYDRGSATIRRIGEESEVVAQLEMMEGEVRDPFGGGLVKVRTAPSLSDMVVDTNQTLWFFILGSSELRGIPL